MNKNWEGRLGFFFFFDLYSLPPAISIWNQWTALCVASLAAAAISVANVLKFSSASFYAQTQYTIENCNASSPMFKAPLT